MEIDETRHCPDCGDVITENEAFEYGSCQQCYEHSFNECHDLESGSLSTAD